MGETRSCGTGAVAAAAAAHVRGPDPDSSPVTYRVDVPGGTVMVELTETQAFLTGPAVLVAHGEVVLPEAGSNQSGVSKMSVLDAFSLSGKVSVVTGANRGIGRALTQALAEAGSDVVLLVRERGGASAAMAELETLGATALVVTADVTDAEQVQAGGD